MNFLKFSQWCLMDCSLSAPTIMNLTYKAKFADVYDKFPSFVFLVMNLAGKSSPTVAFVSFRDLDSGEEHFSSMACWPRQIPWAACDLHGIIWCSTASVQNVVNFSRVAGPSRERLNLFIIGENHLPSSRAASYYNWQPVTVILVHIEIWGFTIPSDEICDFCFLGIDEIWDLIHVQRWDEMWEFINT